MAATSPTFDPDDGGNSLYGGLPNEAYGNYFLVSLRQFDIAQYMALLHSGSLFLLPLVLLDVLAIGRTMDS